jgi:hypothetical protein
VIRAFVSSFLLGGVVLVALYAVTAVPLGRFSLMEHATRIFETEEARDLRESVIEAGDAMERRLRGGFAAEGHAPGTEENVQP